MSTLFLIFLIFLLFFIFFLIFILFFLNIISFVFYYIKKSSPIIWLYRLLLSYQCIKIIFFYYINIPKITSGKNTQAIINATAIIPQTINIFMPIFELPSFFFATSHPPFLFYFFYFYIY